MTIEHVDIGAGEIHEPKGVITAVAGQTYVTTGTGTGNQIRIQGWSQWEDSNTTVGTPTQNIATGVRTQFICDGGSLSLEKNPSDAAVSMWDVATNTHVPIEEFDVYHLRISFTAENYAGANPYLDVELDIGGSIGVIYAHDLNLRKAGAAQRVNISFPVYTGTTYFANGGKIYLTYVGTGTCDIYDTSVFIVRESKNYV